MHIDHVSRNGSCFTDGNDFISRGLAKRVAQKLHLPYEQPSTKFFRQPIIFGSQVVKVFSSSFSGWPTKRFTWKSILWWTRFHCPSMIVEIETCSAGHLRVNYGQEHVLFRIRSSMILADLFIHHNFVDLPSPLDLSKQKTNWNITVLSLECRTPSSMNLSEIIDWINSHVFFSKCVLTLRLLKSVLHSFE